MRGRIGRREVNDPSERQAALVVSFAQQDGQQRFQARAAGRCRPDAAGLGRDIAMNVIGRDRIDFAAGQALPERVRDPPLRAAAD